MFIPKEIIKIGDRILTINNIETLSGTFTEGHEFTVVGESNRGFDLVDDDGNRALEVEDTSLKKN